MNAARKAEYHKTMAMLRRCAQGQPEPAADEMDWFVLPPLAIDLPAPVKAMIANDRGVYVWLVDGRIYLLEGDGLTEISGAA